MRNFPSLILPALLLAAVAVDSSAAARPPVVAAPVAGSTALRPLVQAADHPNLAVGAFGDVKAEVEKAYAAAGWQPLWLDGLRPSPAARQLIARLAGADSLGLDPAEYDAAWLTRTADELAKKKARATEEDRARFDVGLSVAAARFLSALDVGRVASKVAQENSFLAAPQPTAGVTIDALRDASGQAATIRRAEPRFHQYQLLKNALVRYRKLALDPSLNASLDLPVDLRPGGSLPGAARLRKLLEATGDLEKRKHPKAKKDVIYSPELVEAVQRFQARQGQMPDGILFVQTIDALKRPFAGKVRQIELALERWRWLPDTFIAPPLLVNIAAFRLHAYRSLEETRDDALDLDVLVGAADRNETPQFTADMTSLVFRPWWDLPASIQNFELGPRAQWDWENMQRLGYVLVGKDGSVTELTQQNASRIGGNVDMRQKPGESNALGLVKFVLPNGHDIYLHDTPARGLFGFPRRDMSHGCVRVDTPEKLAALVLKGEWSAERALQAMHGEDNVKVALEQPVPVYFNYITTEASPAGAVSFYADVYGLDAELDEVLKPGLPYPTTRAAAIKRVAQGRISTAVPTGTSR